METIATIVIVLASMSSVVFLVYSIIEGVEDARYLKAHRHTRSCLCGGTEVIWFGDERLDNLIIKGENNTPMGYQMSMRVSCLSCGNQQVQKLWRPIYRNGGKTKTLEYDLRAAPQTVLPAQYKMAV